MWRAGFAGGDGAHNGGTRNHAHYGADNSTTRNGDAGADADNDNPAYDYDN